MQKSAFKIWLIGALVTVVTFAANLFYADSLASQAGVNTEVIRTGILSALFVLVMWQLIMIFLGRLGRKNIIFRVIATIVVVSTCLATFQHQATVNGVSIHEHLRILMNIGQLLTVVAVVMLWIPNKKKSEEEAVEL